MIYAKIDDASALQRLDAALFEATKPKWKGGRRGGCLNARRIWASTPQIADDAENAEDAEGVS